MKESRRSVHPGVMSGAPPSRWAGVLRSLALSGLVLSVGLGPGAPEAQALQAPAAQGAEQTSHGTALRPVVGGSRGIVASNHPQASAAGIQILMQGGNAIDAAIATGAALGVVEPFMSGLGGNGWMTIYSAETGQVHVLNFSGAAPRALSAEHFLEGAAASRTADDLGELHPDVPEIPGRGPLVSLVPGSAAAWSKALERFGTMTPAELLEPAIHLAENGYPITAFGSSTHAASQAEFLDWEGIGARTWWAGAQEPPKPGERIRNPNLARTYRTLAERGFDAFYRGDIPREIVGFYQRHGGVIAVEDFEGYAATWEDPLHITYRGHDIYSTAPNSSGGLAILQILRILEGYDLAAMGVNSVDYVHHMVEAIKLAAADRARWSGDPDFMDEEIPLERLLSPEYAAERRATINPRQASVEVAPGISQVGTTHYSIADAAGNIVSVTTTMGSGFGSGVVGGETGVFLNNGVRWFEMDPESPAFVEGGKRTRWNMAPTLIGRNGVPFLALGTPGGSGIWQTQPQLITKIIDFGMDLQNAIESPRFRWELGEITVRPESRLGTEVFAGLEARGHEVQPFGAWTTGVGGMNAVMRDPATGLLQGGADPRRDGYVIGW